MRVCVGGGQDKELPEFLSHWNTLFTSLDPLSNTGSESCSNPPSPSPSVPLLPLSRLSGLPWSQIMSGHSRHLSFPPLPLTPPPPSQLFSCIEQDPDSESIYLSVSLLSPGLKTKKEKTTLTVSETRYPSHGGLGAPGDTKH